MGTPADIARQLPDGTFRVFHVSYDGYLSGVGAKLFKHYNDPAKVDRLFEHSYAPSLEDDPNDFDIDPDEEGWQWYSNDDPIDTFKVMPQPFSKEYYEKYVANEVSYIWKDDKWWYIGYDYDEKTGILTQLAPVEITREMLIADTPSTVEYLDDTTPSVPTHIALNQMFQQAAANNTNPNVKFFGGDGMYGVSATIGGFDAPEDED